MRRLIAVPVLSAALLLSGCTASVALTPAPQATSVGCANVIVRLPRTIVASTRQQTTFERRETDAQGTAAWGNPAVITLRCGVQTPATTDPCGPAGGVDWTTRNVRINGKDQTVLTTFGRSPGVQVVIDQSAISQSDVLPVLSLDAIVLATKATGARCITPAEITDSPSPSTP